MVITAICSKEVGHVSFLQGGLCSSPISMLKNQPIRSFFMLTISWNKILYWLQVVLYFGTEIWEELLKNTLQVPKFRIKCFDPDLLPDSELGRRLPMVLLVSCDQSKIWSLERSLVKLFTICSAFLLEFLSGMCSSSTYFLLFCSDFDHMLKNIYFRTLQSSLNP